jgi:putative membrane protein
MRFIVHTLVTAAALALVALLLSGIHVDGSGPVENTVTLVGVALVFGLVNAFLKPLIRKVGMCLYVATLGLVALVVNALLFLLTEWVADQFGLPFEIDGFWPAFWGALLISIVSWVIGIAIPERKAS